MRKYPVFLAVGFFLFCFNLVLQAAEITYVKGSVQVQFSAGQWKRAKVGMQVDMGDSIRTARRSKADVLLDEESNNFIRIEEQTLVILNSTYPGEINRFDLSHGKIYANIEKTKAGLTYEVSTPSAVAGVRGTGWSGESSDKGDEVATYEGSVFVKTFGKMKELISEITVPQGFKTMIARFGAAGALIDLTVQEMQRWRQAKQDASKRIKSRHKRQGNKKNKMDKISKTKEDTLDNLNKIKDAIKESGLDKIADHRGGCGGAGGAGGAGGG